MSKAGIVIIDGNKQPEGIPLGQIEVLIGGVLPAKLNDVATDALSQLCEKARKMHANIISDVERENIPRKDGLSTVYDVKYTAKTYRVASEELSR